MHLRLVEKVRPILYCFCRKLLNTMAKFRLIFSTLIEWIVFTTKAFLQDMGYLREGDENTEISTGCQCQCQSLALDSSKRGTRYKTGRLTA